MRTIIFAAAAVVCGWVGVMAEGTTTITQKLSQAYDRISTFSADAWVYEYYG